MQFFTYKKINGIPLSDIKSNDKFCTLIEKDLDFDINKYNKDSYELNTIDPRLKLVN